jgi:hypothetical protein
MTNKIKDCAIISFFHFACTFILGLIVFSFSPKIMPLDFCLWLSIGVGVGRFFIELIKSEKLFDKMIAYFKTR